MRRVLVLLISLLFLFPAYTRAASPKEVPDSPQTNLEKLSIKTGVVIIRGFEKIGTIQGQYGTSITVESKEFVNVATGNREYGITIEVKEEKGRYDKERTSYIDYNEIDSLLSGIKYISKVNKTVTKFSNFQADYKTRGGFKISTFSTREGTMVAVSSGTVSTASAYFNISELSNIKNLIEQAKTKIGSLK